MTEPEAATLMAYSSVAQGAWSGWRPQQTLSTASSSGVPSGATRTLKALAAATGNSTSSSNGGSATIGVLSVTVIAHPSSATSPTADLLARGGETHTWG